MKNRTRLLLISYLLITAVMNGQSPTKPEEEFRGVWVATVTNIDWPSARGLPVKALKKEALVILDLQKELGINTVILQVRPSGDAMYPSQLEPWSRYLSGEQGQSPGPHFDPLQFWLSEAHKRGMELHAWINPFRAALNLTDSLCATHPAVLNPDWVVPYGPRLNYNPGLAEVQNFTLSVIKDLLIRYDIDGLHMDDYFYPYPIRGEVFNDSAAYLKSLDFDDPMSIHDWRRDNINRFIAATAELIKEVNPRVKFGISPFGVWRNQKDDPRGSDTHAGVTCYDDLYADVLKWTREGWIDYVIPQVYWSTRDDIVNYNKLVQWWNNNANNRHVYIGHSIYKINNSQPNWDNPLEIGEQINVSRRLPNIKGNAFYSHKHFMRDNNSLNENLKNIYFKTQAIPPAMPWKTPSGPPQAAGNLKYRRGILSWDAVAPENSQLKYRYLVWLMPADGSTPIWAITNNNFFNTRQITAKSRQKYEVKIMTLDPWNNASTWSENQKIKY
ncbi:glycoside hydrolase family 10 protein [Geofilum sp. OHC36d9]|uniref:glycoside hydrolase family 10 protein n=1 Tax=Geofilum sp. OHC36d9 TaxID=3458413 RepID=UPI004033487C